MEIRSFLYSRSNGVPRATYSTTGPLLATRPLAGSMKLRLQAGMTASPNVLDDDDVGSAYYLQVSIGEADDNLSRLVALNSSGTVGVAALQDTVLPYARLRYTRSFESEALFTTD